MITKTSNWYEIFQNEKQISIISCNRVTSWLLLQKILIEKKIDPVLMPIFSKSVDEQLKSAQKVNEAVDRANSETCGILLRYNVDKPERFFAHVA